MDWQAAIETNHNALKRILATLIAMAGLTGGALPRHLHRAALRLLRPAESAARRLIIVAARGLVVALPPARSSLRKVEPESKPSLVRNSIVTGTLTRRALLILNALLPSALRDKALLQAATPPTARPPAFPLLDPRLRPDCRRVAAENTPCFSLPGFSEPFGIPPRRPPSRNDPLNAARLRRRIAALASALDDLPGQARRFARWQASHGTAGAQPANPLDRADARAPKKLSPAAAENIGGHAAVAQSQRPDAGRVRHQRPRTNARPSGSHLRPVHDGLHAAHGLAARAPEYADTS